MKAWGVGLLLALLTSCSAFDPPEVKDCEDRLISSLKAPSTYRRIKASSFVIEDVKPPYQSVGIDYDAANSYGVPLRETRICQYPIKNGRIDLADYTDLGDGLTEPSRPVDNAAVAAILNEANANSALSQ